MPDTPIVTPVETPAYVFISIGDFLLAIDLLYRPLPSDLGNGLAPNVTSRCGKYYTVDVGNDCSTVSLKFNIATKDL
jgi:hypothetical protein